MRNSQALAIEFDDTTCGVPTAQSFNMSETEVDHDINSSDLEFKVHDEVILEGPSESAEVAKAIVVECMAKPFHGKNILKVDLSVDAKCAQNWYSAK
ncbi:hypothetical protein Ahy_B07g088622 [Arachis hypogaea]|uniref:Uncharacterized protein n=1 Tax=Arachis hypogaea TaxID=3818 RepID=A0A444YF02_ARAHY|nr:hypothetical protein Ahy_B07g088622 [Arachis hypogaea]